jgi:lysophospholipase L1-like esterase
MPLGDSITRGWYGSEYSWGYRKPLYDALTNGGYNFDFVGIKNDGSFSDPSHEGRDGWQANELLNGRPSAPAEGKLTDWLTADQPDIILLHIGTNDVTWNDINFNDVNKILDVIDGYEVSSGKHVTVFLALIINRRIDSTSTKRAQTTQFNRDVNNIALGRIANGDDIIIVDMESALNYNIGVDMADEVHPNDAGYAKMAAVWYNALVGYFSNLPVAISGYVLKAKDSTPVEGLLIKTDDNDISALTDANGYYQLPVDYNWSGTIIPQKDGYIVDPNKETFTNVTQDYNYVNYTAIPITFKITGFVFEQDSITPISNVNISADNGGGATLTDANGYYEVLVDYNWSGNLIASKGAYRFEPNSRHYEFVDQNYSADQDYTGDQFDFKITGFIKNQCGAPIEGVLVDADNGGGEDTTDTNGFYEVWVNSAWSGVVTPGRQHYTFDPSWISYVSVLADQPDQNYIANSVYDLDCDGPIGWGDVGVMADNWLKKTGAGDIDKDGDVDFSDFAEFGVAW